MPSLNEVMIIGSLEADPEVRRTQSGDAVANIRVAVTEKWQSKNGEQHEETEWFRVVLWHRLAEIAEQYLHKGDTVYVDGRLKTRKWQDSEGQDMYTVEVQGRKIQMLGSPKGKKQAPASVGDLDDDIPL